MADATDVKTESSEKEAVAFKLMQHIGSMENKPDIDKTDRAYWLALYRQCYRTVSVRRKKQRAPAAQK